MQREQTVVQLPRLLELVRRDSLVELRAQLRRDIGGNRDAAAPACRRVRQPQLVIARQLAELAPDTHAVIGHARQVAARVLDGDDPVGILVDQRHHGLVLEIGHRASGHVVEHDRQITVLGEKAEMGDQPALARAVVIGGNAQPRCRAGLAREVHMEERVARVVRAAARDHRHAARGLLDADLDHAVMLGIRERRSLARRAARHQRRAAVLDLPVDQPPEGRLVKRPAAKRSHQSGYRSAEHCFCPAFIVKLAEVEALLRLFLVQRLLRSRSALCPAWSTRCCQRPAVSR